MFILPLYTVISIAFGTVDPIFRGPLPVYEPWWWSGEQFGKVLKEGFCLGNIKMYDWHSFSQAEIDPRSVDNCEPSPQPDGSWRFYEGIASGWEDIYTWAEAPGRLTDEDQDGFRVVDLHGHRRWGVRGAAS